MNVITENEIVYINSPESEDAETFLYSEGPNISDIAKNAAKSGSQNIQVFDGAKIKAKEPSNAEKERAKKKGLVWDNVKKVYVKAQELGIVDSLLAKIGLAPKQTDVPGVGVEQDPTTGQPLEKSGMNTTTKVLIAVGVVAVIGVILYSSKKK